MPITVVCTNCGRSYAADESLAGRRVRCRGCGEIVQIPLVDEPGQAPQDFGGFDQPEPGFGDDAAMATHAGFPADDGTPAALPSGMEEVEVSAAGIEAAGRANLRYNFLGAKTVDDLLPWLLVVGSLLWFGIQTSRNNPSGQPWITATRVALPLLLFTVLVCPLVYTSLRAAGRTVGFQLPRTARWRTFACYLPAMTLTAALWMMGSGTLVSFVMGVLAGLLLASGCLWILFRLKPEEAPPTAAYGATGFIIGAVASAAILAGLNMVARSVVESTGALSSVPASPLGSGFEWVDPAKVTTTARPAPRPLPRPAPTDARTPEVSPTPTDAGVTVVTPAPSPEPTETAPVEAPPVAPPEVATNQESPTVPGDAPPVAPTFEGPRSPLVASFSVAPTEDGTLDFISPMTPSPFVAMTRREGDVLAVTLWNSEPWQKTGQARFSAAAGIGDRIAISPDGAYAVRLASFPATAIQVWSFADNRELARIPLNTSMGTPEIVGFLTPDRVVIKWTAAADGTTILDFYDVKAGARARDPLKIGVPVSGANSIAFSPNGAFLAVAAKVQNEPSLLFFAAAGERPSRTVRIRMLDPRWPVEPTGMAFAPDTDGTRDNIVGLMFEQAGVALVVAYRQDGMVIGEHVYDPGPPAPRPAAFAGSALDWITSPDQKKRWWLIYGQAVIDPSTGSNVGLIDLSDVERVHTAGKSALLFIAGRNQGRRAPVHARLDVSTLGR